jgi:hypothetical protein
MMADEQAMGAVVDEPIEALLLAIPEEQVDRALAAIKALDSSAEVAGFAFGAPIKSGPISGTSCTITSNNTDFNCKDSDRS